MNPSAPSQPKTRAKATTAYVYLQPVELESVSKNATQIEIRDTNNKPLGRFFIGRIGMSFVALIKRSEAFKRIGIN